MIEEIYAEYFSNIRRDLVEMYLDAVVGMVH